MERTSVSLQFNKTSFKSKGNMKWKCYGNDEVKEWHEHIVCFFFSFGTWESIAVKDVQTFDVHHSKISGKSFTKV